MTYSAGGHCFLLSQNPGKANKCNVFSLVKRIFFMRQRIRKLVKPKIKSVSLVHNQGLWTLEVSAFHLEMSSFRIYFFIFYNPLGVWRRFVPGRLSCLKIGVSQTSFEGFWSLGYWNWWTQIASGFIFTPLVENKGIKTDLMNTPKKKELLWKEKMLGWEEMSR